jgi:hypothetical protein
MIMMTDNISNTLVKTLEVTRLGMVVVVGEYEAALNRYINQELRDLV